MVRRAVGDGQAWYTGLMIDDYTAYRSPELAAVYDAVYSDVDDRSFWRAMAAAAGDGPLLELGCGTGRVLLPLAREGYEVTGVDRSRQMLDHCRAKLELESAHTRDRVTLVESDMSSFDLGRTFGAIFCAFNGFHHLRTTDQQLGCLERCHAHLVSQGMLVLDLFNPDPSPGERHGDEPAEAKADVLSVDWTDGRRIRGWISACDYDRSLQCNECEMTYEIVETDGTARRLTETFPLRLLYRFELEHLLARCGFRMAALHGGYDLEPFAEDSVGMIVVAEPIAV
jgi:SAM-dependent methyltransferase